MGSGRDLNTKLIFLLQDGAKQSYHDKKKGELTTYLEQIILFAASVIFGFC